MDTRQILEKIKVLWSENALGIISAALVLVVGLAASRVAKRWVAAVIDRSRIKNDLLLRSFFLRLTTLTIISLAVLIALNRIGVQVGAFVAGLGVTGIILGFGLRDTLANFAAGVLLLIYRPFRAGEVIEVEGSQGMVEELTIVNMQMTTNDGVRVIMPNSKVWGAKITNYSMSQRRRLELTLKVREEDAELAIAAIRKALDADERVLKTPPPSIGVTSVADNATVLTIWAWTSPADFLAVGANQYLRLLAALREAEVQIS